MAALVNISIKRQVVTYTRIHINIHLGILETILPTRQPGAFSMIGVALPDSNAIEPIHR